MFKTKEIEKQSKTKDYDFLDGLAFFYNFAQFYDEQQFGIDEETGGILFDMMNLLKAEYKNPTLNKIDNHDFLSVFKLTKNEQEEYMPQFDYMTKKDLSALQKYSYSVAKKIYIKLGKTIDITNKYSDEINDLSWQIFFLAESKKEQNALIQKQDELFKKEKKEDEIIESKIKNHVNRTMALQLSFMNSQYTYSMTKKSHKDKIKNYVESKLKQQNNIKLENPTKKEDELNR